MSAIRVGLMTIMSETKTWPQELVDLFSQKHKKAFEALCTLGFEAVTPGDEIGRTYSQMVRQAQSLRTKNIDALVLFVPAWAFSSNAVAAGFNVGVPVIVWSDAAADQFGICGAAIIRGALDEVGIKNTLIHGEIGDSSTMMKLERWIRGISVATRLRNTRFGIGGSRCMGMYTAHVDPSEIMKKFGVDIDGWEQVDVIKRSERVAATEVAKMIEWLHGAFGGVEVSDKVLEAQARMYLGLLELIEEKKYDAVCVKCLPELPSVHTTFCMAMALLNDRSDYRGSKESVVCGCEADINGTLTMQMLKLLNGGPVMFTDVLKIYRERNEIGLANCGSSATDFARSKKDVRWVKEGLVEFDWKAGLGAALPQYITREGIVTIARLSRIDGKYVMLISRGRTVEYPREKLAEICTQHPQSYVTLEPPIEAFIENLRCNHLHFIFGDFVEELRIACGILEIQPIVL